MTTRNQLTPPPALLKMEPVVYDYMGGFLSFLVPGLGQITQGRYGKGLMFLVCLYGLFFYGMFLGSWKNVFIPRNHDGQVNDKGQPTKLLYDISTRYQFIGQAPIGIAAWPAIYQYAVYPADEQQAPLQGFMRAPNAEEFNRLQRDGDKTYDLGWVYTVIAGVLNILVIYDAIAGPAFRKGHPALAEPAPAPSPEAGK